MSGIILKMDIIMDKFKTIEYNDFIIDYSLFLINEFNFTRDEAYENAKSWWFFLCVKNKEKIRGFRKIKMVNHRFKRGLHLLVEGTNY